MASITGGTRMPLRLAPIQTPTPPSAIAPQMPSPPRQT